MNANEVDLQDWHFRQQAGYGDLYEYITGMGTLFTIT